MTNYSSVQPVDSVMAVHRYPMLMVGPLVGVALAFPFLYRAEGWHSEGIAEQARLHLQHAPLVRTDSLTDDQDYC